MRTFPQRSVLEGNHLLSRLRGTFVAELGQTAAAVAHFRQAAKLALLPVERDFLARRDRRVRGCETQLGVNIECTAALSVLVLNPKEVARLCDLKLVVIKEDLIRRISHSLNQSSV